MKAHSIQENRRGRFTTSSPGEPVFDGVRFVVEPGRFLVAEAGIYVARVTDVKVSRGKKFVS